jgi:hypothetical protein
VTCSNSDCCANDPVQQIQITHTYSQKISERKAKHPDRSGKFNIEIKKEMKTLQRDWRGIYRHNFSYKNKCDSNNDK